MIVSSGKRVEDEITEKKVEAVLFHAHRLIRQIGIEKQRIAQTFLR